MDTGQSLFAEIRPEQFDLAELHWLLLQRSRSASQPSPNEVVYRGDLADYTVKLRLGDAGEVSDILVAPSFKERDALRDQIVSELLTSAGPRIASVILFSDLPVDGYYKHGTVLQIVPAPREAPRPKFLLGEHPFLLQFSFPSSTNWAVRKIRKETRGREIAFVLAGLLAGSVHSLSGGEHHWILHLGKPEGVTSEYLQAGYVCPGLVDESDAFSPIQNLAALPQLEPRVYYFRWGLSGESKFEVPTNLSELLDGFFKLPSMRRNQFVRACYWFSLAGQFYVCSRSAAFAASREFPRSTYGAREEWTRVRKLWEASRKECESTVHGAPRRDGSMGAAGCRGSKETVFREICAASWRTAVTLRLLRTQPGTAAR